MTLITIEGIDGAGKSTLAAALAGRLPHAVLLREPGGVALAERVREVVKDPSLRVGARAEALLYAAARAQLVEEAVRPALERGETVLVDRFIDSSLAYQGVGRGLGVDAVRAINDFGAGGLVPDRTLLVRLDPAVARARAGGRGEAPDRLEAEGDAFFAAIARAYDELAAAERERFVVLDGTRSPEALVEDALRALGPLAGRGH
ncbi:MAG TPA: dTMP kinase [Capillimicrobium sp.]|nr:dTMP kinase [Capillimicrobium sp.]